MTVFTVVVEWNGDRFTREEIDVRAGSEREARREAERVLAEDYEPGGVIVEVGPLTNAVYVLRTKGE